MPTVSLSLKTFGDDSLLLPLVFRSVPLTNRMRHPTPQHTTTQKLAPLALPKVIFSKKPAATTPATTKATASVGLLKGALDAPPGVLLRPPGELAPVVRAGGFSRPPSARPSSAARRGAPEAAPNDTKSRVSCRRTGAATWRRAAEVASQERELRSTSTDGSTGGSGAGGRGGSRAGLSTRRHASARYVSQYTSHTPQSVAAASAAPVAAARFRRTSML